ncbi:MAG: STM4012 family radical SAM protein [Myxococcales bacterium]|nr:STM4012 family radical SAM protein [Myxococcales bacterium]
MDEALSHGSPYQAYVYGYPHKTAYRPLAPARRLAEVWADEPKSALSLYVHVPFCEMRCGFCNLFTSPRPREDRVERYLATLARQIERVGAALGPVRFARFAIGGGTPTWLSPHQLHALFDRVATLGADPRHCPTSVEVSPETATHERLAVLRARGVDRVSIGVQSFVESESAAVARPQATTAVEGALDAIRGLGFPTLNVDLMYGLPGQSPATWERSLRAALRSSPEELYLYPTYVRPLTGLGRRGESWDDLRVSLYRQGRALLLAEGYTQLSMRMFRAPHAPVGQGPAYCVQDDGMVGLGPGARSYTRALHYGTDYAVSAPAVREAIEAWTSRESDEFDWVDHGIALDVDEQRRRWVALGLLGDGLDRAAYAQRFGIDVLAELPWLERLFELGLATVDAHRVALTELGVERSDAVGPFLFSAAVRARMASWEPR